MNPLRYLINVAALGVIFGAPLQGRAETIRTYRRTPDFKSGPAPRALLGLWAKGGKCGIRGSRLRITQDELHFAGKPPVSYRYIPGVPHFNQGSLDFSKTHPDLTFELDSHILLYYDDQSDPGHIYFPCFGPNPGWPPRSVK